MRAAGEVHQALLRSCQVLAAQGPAPTLRELAHHACVGITAARTTVANMRRRGVLRIVGTRRVDYASRPVAQYATESYEAPGDGARRLQRAMQAWGR